MSGRDAAANRAALRDSGPTHRHDGDGAARVMQDGVHHRPQAQPEPALDRMTRNHYKAGLKGIPGVKNRSFDALQDARTWLAQAQTDARRGEFVDPREGPSPSRTTSHRAEGTSAHRSPPGCSAAQRHLHGSPASLEEAAGEGPRSGRLHPSGSGDALQRPPGCGRGPSPRTQPLPVQHARPSGRRTRQGRSVAAGTGAVRTGGIAGPLPASCRYRRGPWAPTGRGTRARPGRHRLREGSRPRPAAGQDGAGEAVFRASQGAQGPGRAAAVQRGPGHPTAHGAVRAGAGHAALGRLQSLWSVASCPPQAQSPREVPEMPPHPTLAR
jgi:hypothetical protein